MRAEQSGLRGLAAGCRRGGGVACGRGRGAAARRGPRGMGSDQSAPRSDAHARANLHQRPLAMAAGREDRWRANRPLGLFQSPGLLVGNQRLHAARLPDGLPASKLERREAGRDRRGLVPAGNQRSQPMGRPPHHPRHGVPQFQRHGLRRWQEGRRGAVPGGRSGSHVRLPPREQARYQPPGRRQAAPGNHADVQRYERGPAGTWPGRAARSVRRRVPRRRPAAGPHRPRQGRYVRARRSDHPERGAGKPDAGHAIHAPRRDHRRRPQGPRVPQPAVCSE